MRVEKGELIKESLRALEKASFPTGVEWNIWWRHWRRRLDEQSVSGWEHAIVDGVGKLMDNQLLLARMIRLEGDAKQMMRYNSEGQVIGEENREPEDITREAFNWWLHMARPALLKDGTLEAQPGVPEWATTLAQAVEGCYIQQCRLGIELTSIKRKGYLTINASATKTLPTDKTLHDHGMAALGSFKDSDREEV